LRGDRKEKGIARALALNLDGQEFSVLLAKVDRSGLYGEVTIEAFNEKGDPAEIKVLASDGSTLIDKGGTALEMLNKAGDSLERGEIETVDLEGNPIEPVESSFRHVNDLSEAKLDDYLSLIVKNVYWLQPGEDSDMSVLHEHLGDGRIYSFPFAYRDGIETDEAYLVGSTKEAFMIVGDQATLRYMKFDQPVFLDDTEEEEVSADDLSFDLM
jgi:hypothetical protein